MFCIDSNPPQNHGGFESMQNIFHVRLPVCLVGMLTFNFPMCFTREWPNSLYLYKATGQIINLWEKYLRLFSV